MEAYLTNISAWLVSAGLGPGPSRVLAAMAGIATVIVAMWVLYVLLTRLCEPLIKRIANRTETRLDDVLLDHRSMRWAWALIEGIIAYLTLPTLLRAYPLWQQAVVVMIEVGLILSLMMLTIEMVRRFFIYFTCKDDLDDVVEEIQSGTQSAGSYLPRVKSSLRPLVQMLIVIIVCGAVVLIISVLVGKNPLIIFSGLGAMAAVLLLVFQDSILGVVAGVQITANKMLEHNDWIIAPKFGANGRVLEISLAAVKVLNWDNSITTIPPYKLLTEGFQNWHNMFESQGRRIARSVNIDMTTIAFATDEQLARWQGEPWWQQRAGRPTNVTALRMYLEHYVSHQPTLTADMMWMVRELEPTAQGLPIEVYFFTTKTEWVAYEREQADVMDHIMAIIPDFGLRTYQQPSQNITVSLQRD